MIEGGGSFGQFLAEANNLDKHHFYGMEFGDADITKSESYQNICALSCTNDLITVLYLGI